MVGLIWFGLMLKVKARFYFRRYQKKEVIVQWLPPSKIEIKKQNKKKTVQPGVCMRWWWSTFLEKILIIIIIIETET